MEEDPETKENVLSPSEEAKAPSVLVVVNDEESPLRRFEPWLDELSVRVTMVSGDDVPSTADGIDGTILLSGGFMPDDYERAP